MKKMKVLVLALLLLVGCGPSQQPNKEEQQLFATGPEPAAEAVISLLLFHPGSDSMRVEIASMVIDRLAVEGVAPSDTVSISTYAYNDTLRVVIK